AGVAREEPKDPLTVVALAALDEARPELGAGDRVLSWARAQLDAPAMGEDVDAVERARQLTALARAAKLAAPRGELRGAARPRPTPCARARSRRRGAS